MKVREYDADRFDRMRRIDWLDMVRIQSARCLVVGAGALGNEVMKCMLLAGFRDITIVDMDEVVVSNLSRCVFFRESDNGKKKAEVVAERAADLYPGSKITPITAKIQDLDDWEFDLVFGCLDNITARLHVNSHARYNKIPYIDGATDGFRGKVQVVLETGPCLECGMNSSHMKVMDERFSCTGEGSVFIPKFAAEITTTSIIAATQVREAIKLLSGRRDSCVRNVMYYDGLSGAMADLEISEDSSCPNHFTEGSK
ncbi:SAMP-activating enzyme E1 [Candidatus Methanoplasma termitum]|uniref:UbaA protein n=1 Tax=Candidatus Methanoplasma termitum TaxID=1577791 RepID=A0A0A7LC91_9ARCH|nr:ThiF family adenylyltransferase [Candidatus Methanoplasma termitum]AIZ55942.1 SAMP-activating enzyme E1 [Candidatus Methanoplasma termitum]MCL2334260.1 ThiF family adenylyltransferase [Candidatus Methanoplasma sp.]